MPSSYVGGCGARPASKLRSRLRKPVQEEIVEEVVGAEEVVDYSSYTVAGLRFVAQDLDVPNYAKLKKTELVTAIEDAVEVVAVGS